MYLHYMRQLVSLFCVFLTFGLSAQEYSDEAKFGGCKTPSLNYPTYRVTVIHEVTHPKLKKPSLSEVTITRGGEFWELDYGNQIMRSNGEYVAFLYPEDKIIELQYGLDFDEYIQNPFFYIYDSFAHIQTEDELVTIQMFNEEWEEDYREIVYNQDDCVAVSVKMINPGNTENNYYFKNWELYIDLKTSSFNTPIESYREKGWKIYDMR